MNKELKKLITQAVIKIAESDPAPQHRARASEVQFDWYESQISEILKGEPNQPDAFYEDLAMIFNNATRELVSLCGREDIILEGVDD